jgi:hypothetical protein
MKRFKQYIIEESPTNGKRNTGHMTHIEDQVLYGGVKGAREAIIALRNLRDMLAGNSPGSYDIAAKFDGAPAIFVGTDPSDNKFFVAKKGIFNKNPKVYKSIKDIQADTSGDLAKKLSVAFVELQKIGIKGILQGDLAFTQDDLKTETFEGEKYLTFQPNTIVYAIPHKSELAKTISKAKIGVMFHTQYVGDSFENMKAIYGFNSNTLKKSPNVWFADTYIRDLSGTATLTAKETQELNGILSRAGKIFQKINSTTLKQIESNPILAQNLETFNNTLVRRGEKITNPRAHVQNLIAWVSNKFKQEIDSKKTQSGKETVTKKMNEYMSFFSNENKENLELVYQLQNAIVDAKLIIINKLETLKKMKTFAKTKNGFIVVKQEGFAINDRIDFNVVKLVDRMEFSKLNFSPDIIKGWDR